MDQGSLSSVFEICSSLNAKAAEQAVQGATLRARKQDALQKIKQAAATSPGVIPSGPRKQGEGCDDEDQGIVAAKETRFGGAQLSVTLLAAGFLIGPSGASIRAVSQKTGADIRSWSETCIVGAKHRRVRTIVVEGSRRAVLLALTILTAAVERYKELCEGKYCGKTVERLQTIHGVDFFYSPPPRSAVPFAAALKMDPSPGSPTASGGATNSGSSGHRSSTASPQDISQKENLPLFSVNSSKKGSDAPPAAVKMVSPMGSTGINTSIPNLTSLRSQSTIPPPPPQHQQYQHQHHQRMMNINMMNTTTDDYFPHFPRHPTVTSEQNDIDTKIADASNDPFFAMIQQQQQQQQHAMHDTKHATSIQSTPAPMMMPMHHTYPENQYSYQSMHPLYRAAMASFNSPAMPGGIYDQYQEYSKEYSNYNSNNNNNQQQYSYPLNTMYEHNNNSGTMMNSTARSAASPFYRSSLNAMARTTVQEPQKEYTLFRNQDTPTTEITCGHEFVLNTIQQYNNNDNTMSTATSSNLNAFAPQWMGNVNEMSHCMGDQGCAYSLPTFNEFAKKSVHYGLEDDTAENLSKSIGEGCLFDKLDLNDKDEHHNKN